LGILKHLEDFARNKNFTQREAAVSISHKIEQYWMLMDKPSTVSSILDSRNKLTLFTDELKQNAVSNIESIYEIYKERSSLPIDSPQNTPKST
jgi:hypothetical protein